MKNWSNWKPIPSPQRCKEIDAPDGSGAYQIRNNATNQLIQFGMSVTCQKRMKSLFPAPYGSGTRNNDSKRQYVLDNWKLLEYRTIATESRQEAAQIEAELKSQGNHLFNT